MSTGYAASSPPERWFYGRSVDLLFGCGLAYLLAFPLLLFVDGTPPIIALAVMNIFIAGPHYGATMLRVFQRREGRRTYARFALFVSVLALAAFLLGLRDVWLGSLLVTLYVTWSPWHFSGQNYGLSLMFLRRRGVAITSGQKRLLYASFWLSFTPAFLILHSAVPNVEYVPIATGLFETFRILPIGIPMDLATLLIPVFAIAYLGTLVLLAIGFLRVASPADLLPSALIIGLQSLWFVVPGFLFSVGVNRYTSVVVLPIALSAVHSIQYLWVSSYYAKREHPATRLLPYLGKATFAASTALGVTLILFSPKLLGTVPFDSGLALLAAAVLNLHHFLLDGAIWKLRDGRLAKLLLGSGEDRERSASASTRDHFAWLRGLAWAAASVFVLVEIFYVYELGFVTTGNTTRATEATERLAWIGRDSARGRGLLAYKLADSGFHHRALEEIERSLTLLPTTETFMLKGHIHEKDRYWSAALEAYDAALALDPGLEKALARRGVVAERALGR